MGMRQCESQHTQWGKKEHYRKNIVIHPGHYSQKSSVEWNWTSYWSLKTHICKYVCFYKHCKNNANDYRCHLHINKVSTLLVDDVCLIKISKKQTCLPVHCAHHTLSNSKEKGRGTDPHNLQQTLSLMVFQHCSCFSFRV